jgi:S1-C subfamily serine protease
MLRALCLASLVLVSAVTASGQALSVLRIKVVVVDSEGTVTAVPRHALLVSDNPASAPPRRIVTALDGTAEVKLRPGNYTVESDRPTAFRGKAYQWTQVIDIVAGRDATLELTADNADTEPATSATTSATESSASDPSFLLPQWQDSVVALWTPNTRASGFLIDAKGLIATNQRTIGAATTVEVQLTPEVKVAARVLAADAVRDVAVLWIDPTVVAAVRPLPLECAQAAKPAVVDGQELFTIGVPLREREGMVSGTVGRVEPRFFIVDFRLSPGGAGGPVFAADGGLVGIASVIDGNDESRPGPSRIVRVDDACAVVAAAQQKMQETPAPDATRLPVEPMRPFPIDALKDEAQRRAGNLNPRQMSSSDFDVAFITPVLLYGAQARGNEGSRGPLTDFGNWSEYVEDFPPVLLIRVTPKLVEGFWTTVGRAAARTQGMSIPPIKRVKSGFSRMRVLCGDAELTPIHPFTIEQRVSDSEAIREGLYAFDPSALGPHCGTAKLVLYSEKEPEKGDVRVVDPDVLQDIWLQFAPYRAGESRRPVLASKEEHDTRAVDRRLGRPRVEDAVGASR